MSPEILEPLLKIGGPWVLFLLALWIFREYVEIRFRAPARPRTPSARKKPRA